MDRRRQAAYAAFDLVLGVLGTVLTLTAARDFRAHARVASPVSGTLGADATVKVSEMIEHSFYQGLNLVQIAVLHALPHARGLAQRVTLLASERGVSHPSRMILFLLLTLVLFCPCRRS